MVKLTVFAILLIVMISCVNSESDCGKVKIDKPTPLIVSGEPAYHGQFPWLAPLFHSGKYICGSSIISQWHLLTAAHCVNERSANKYHPLVGRFDLTNSNELHWKRKNISTIYAHEDFDIDAEVQRSDGDIAILRVTDMINYSLYIQPVCLPEESANAVNKYGVTAGFGKTEIYGDHQNTPSYVTLKAISNWRCGKKGIVYANIIAERSFCAGDPANLTSIPCQGDSGGAFLVHDRAKDQYTMLGIVSFSIGRCNPRNYVAFADVTQYIQWINETIEFDELLFGESSNSCENVDCGDKGECQINGGKTECVCLSQYSGIYPQCEFTCSNNSNCLPKTQWSSTEQPHLEDQTQSTLTQSNSPIERSKDICLLQYESGACRERHRRFYYDRAYGICTQFAYSGCDGNENNFETIEECEQLCNDVVDLCDLAPLSGRCDENITRWYFDAYDTSPCRQFDYTGCEGNKNNFDDERSCLNACQHKLEEGSGENQAPVQTQRPPIVNNLKTVENSNRSSAVCDEPEEEGSCDDYIINYTYDKEIQACKAFYYGGCGGNGNRFETREDCESVCIQQQKQVPLAASISLPEGRLYSIGNKISLYCNVTGEPQTEITWYKDNEPIKDSTYIKISGKNQLIVYDAQPFDSGNYSCAARNEYSQAHAVEVISVEGVHVPFGCRDSKNFANCGLIIKGKYCNHKYYAKFCCRSCTLEGQI